MASSPFRTVWVVAAVVVAVGVAAGVFFLWKGVAPLPSPGSPAYEQYVEAFEVGVAAVDVEVVDVAEKNLTRAIDLVPQEPAGWANRALVEIRTAQLTEAERDLKEAERLAPDDADVLKLRAALEEKRGKFSEAVASLRKATEKDPQDVEALHFLAVTLDREQKADSDAEVQKAFEKIIAVRPANRRALGERLRIAARRSDRTAVTDTIARLKNLAPGWARQETRDRLADLEKAAAGPPGEDLLGPVDDFLSLLRAEPGYTQEVGELLPAAVYRGNPLRTFRRLTPPRHEPADPDAGLTFKAEPLPDAPAGKWDAVLPGWPTGDGRPVVVLANATEVRVGDKVLPGLAGTPTVIDWNNDFRNDLLLAGPGGLRFYQQDDRGGYADVTAKTGLAADVLKGDYAAVLVADIDLDGDLDIVLGRQSGPPLLLRNNFDGTFLAKPIFADVADVRAFVWGDLDHDGAPDAALLDAKGRLHVFANERSERFTRWASPEGTFAAMAVSDADDDGVLDLIALRTDGAVVRISDRIKRAKWDVAELARWGKADGVEPGSIRLLVEDLDNNGVPDLIASGPKATGAWLGAGGGKFAPLEAPVPPRVVAAVDLQGKGRLDFLVLDIDGRPVVYRNVGTKEYHWQAIRFRAAVGDNTGDNRINSFGVGGEVEVRTGTFVVKRPVTAAPSHFGLGTRAKCDILRVVWPNGTPQVEFDAKVDQPIVPEQRLKGSCPFLFTWDGEKFVFVTDFMWSTPLGMYINAQDQGGFLQTAEWVRIRGEQLVPKDGKYEVRVNANLWETHYFDHLALHVIDHPADTELYSDERFALEPSQPNFHLTGPTRPVAKAWDHHGADATAAVRAVDGEYLDRAGRGRYQGITADHWVEVDLGDDAPTAGPVWLVAHGWIHPTDSSVNYALEQGTNTRPRALTLETPDGKGGWKVVRDRIGFPAGKNKTVLLRLDGLAGPGVTRRFRLRTNMEIYWDALHWARGRDDAGVKKVELLPTVADLRPRGILAMTQANKSSPELPHYDRVVATRQVWRDLIGYHTRFGDVRELLEKVDDRYAILTAGDDVRLAFDVPPGPPPGWRRDFLWASDGWVKDGDLNTRFGKTVLPLPAHGMPAYDGPLTLETDPVYRRHRMDWKTYHTRFVTPGEYERGLRPTGVKP